MRFSGFAFALAALALVFATPAAFASNDPCKVLTAEKFSQIMGYTATIDKTASTASNCFYQGPPHSGGQFMILTETASGPQADAMLNRRGSTPPAATGRQRTHRRLFPAGKRHLFGIHPVHGQSEAGCFGGRDQTQPEVTNG